MRCPKCGSPYSQTAFTHKKNENLQDKILRTRRCDDCGYMFNTIETFYDGDIQTYISDKTRSEKELAACKHKAMKTAKELYYGQAVVDKIQEAKSIEQVGRILKSARNRH